VLLALLTYLLLLAVVVPLEVSEAVEVEAV
jgi:hypothetical protein